MLDAVADIPASAYVQRGLLVQFDGIENAGTGQPHDSSATTWANLKDASSPMTLDGDYVWTADGVDFNKTATTGVGTFVVPATPSATGRTVETAACPTDGRSNGRFFGEYDLPCLYLSSQRFAIWASGMDGSICERSVFDPIGHFSTYGVSVDISSKYTVTHFDGARYTEKTTTGTPVYATPLTSYLANRSGKDRAMTGTFYALRVYDRVLTDDEVAYNANIDRVRFEGASPASLTWPEICRWNAGTQQIEFRVRVASGDATQCTVVVDGKDIGAYYDTWIALGTERTIEIRVKPKAGWKFIHWESDGLTPAETVSPTLSVTATQSMMLTPVFTYDIPTRAYVQKGLVVQFDGIENAGAGQLHGSSATTWTDLSGNGRNGTCQGVTSWTPIGLKIESKKASNASVVTFDGSHTEAMTIESCLEVYASVGTRGAIVSGDGGSEYKEPQISCKGTAAAVPYVYGFGKDQAIGNATYDSTVPHTTSVRQSGAVADGVYWFNDGSLLGTAAIASTSTGQEIAHLGNRGGGFDRGIDATYYAFRIYNRALTDAEILFNANLDKMRFETAAPTGLTWPQGYRYNSTTCHAESRIVISYEEADGSVTTNGVGVASGEDVWTAVDSLDEVVFVASPAEGMEFAFWEGDVEDLTLAQRTSPTLRQSGGVVRSFVAVFRPAGASVHRIPTTYPTLADALASPSVLPGDTIQIAEGTYRFEQLLDDGTGYYCFAAVRKGVAIKGESGATVVLDCWGAGGIVLDDPDALLENVVISNFCTDVAAPALYAKRGAVSGVTIDGYTSLTTFPEFYPRVYTGPSVRLTDSVIRNLKFPGYSYSVGVSCAGGTWERVVFCDVPKCNAALVSFSSSGGLRATVKDCTFENLYSNCGMIRLSGADMTGCVIRNNEAGERDPIVAMSALAVMDGCVMTNNYGKGSNSEGGVIKCAASTTSYMTNCLVANNRGTKWGCVRLGGAGACVEMCNVTLAHNRMSTSSVASGFSSDGTASSHAKVRLRNTIVWNNTSNGVLADFESSHPNTDFICVNSCFTGLEPTVDQDNVHTDPLFTGAAGSDYTLGEGSSCIDKGADTPDVPVDLNGDERPIDGLGLGNLRWDIGCYEAPTREVALQCTLTADGGEGVSPCSATQTVEVIGAHLTGLSYEWLAIRNANGTVTTNKQFTAEPRNVFEDLEPGRYSFACVVRNQRGDVAEDSVDDVFLSLVETCYVSTNGNNVWPYAKAADAARELKDAVEMAAKRVVVSPGNYQFEHTVDTKGTGKECICALHRPMSIVGADDPNDVVVNCGGYGGIVVDNVGARFSGMTFEKFYTKSGASPLLDVKHGIVSNIVVRGSGSMINAYTLISVGDGALVTDMVASRLEQNGSSAPTFKLSGGTLRRSTVTGCQMHAPLIGCEASAGGTPSLIEDCTIIGNGDETKYGAILVTAVNTDLRGCTITGNLTTTGYPIVSLKHSSASNCVFTCNTSRSAVEIVPDWDGDNYWDGLCNCLIANNTNRVYGAVSITTLYTIRLRLSNVTIADNVCDGGDAGGVSAPAPASKYSGNADSVTMRNCIVWGNTVGGAVKNMTVNPKTKNYSNSCFSEAGDFADAGNVATDPIFLSSRPYHFDPESPCYNTGVNLGWEKEGKDLDGNPRLFGRRVDMGCYECQKGLGLLLFVK